jgi:F-type H+-transporting ATPase subunit epsilon
MMIHCRIVTPQGVYKEMDTPILNVETNDGQQGILPNHMPLVTMLKIGRMSTTEDGQRVEYAIAGGLLYFTPNQAQILTDAIESKEEIDAQRAESAKQRAMQHLHSGDPNEDLKRATVALEKALNRLNVKNGH